MILELTLQSKGGSGKSFYTYFRALASSNDDSIFLDVDSSTNTSSRQLKFLESDRLEAVSLVDSKGVLIRDTFLGYMESVADSNMDATTKIIADLGSAESDQLVSMLEFDISFREFCDELGFKVIFNVIIAGGGAYKASVNYLQRLVSVANGEFEIVVWENVMSFNQFPSLSKELAENCVKMGLRHRKFGDFSPASLIGGQVIEGTRRGYSLSDYSPGARIRIKKELKENFSHE